MKLLVFSECSPEDWDVLLKVDAVYQANRANFPEKYPRYVLKTSFIGADLPKLTQQIRIVDVYEVENPEQLTNYWVHWNTQLFQAKSYRKWLIPLQEGSDAYVAEFSYMRQLIEKMKEQSKTSR